MESKYDRVEYPENVYLHSDGEMEDFGTGVYPVQRRPYQDDKIKVACIKVKRRFRFFAVVAVLILVLVIVAIAVLATATVSNHDQQKPHVTTNDKKYGLFFYPWINNKSLITFDPNNFESYRKYSDNIEFHANPYSTVKMSNQPEAYAKCTDSSGPPDGKECQLDASEFGNECTYMHHHGFEQGRPCVLLVLKLPSDIKPIPFSNTSTVYQKLGQHWSPDHIGVTCDGADEDSKKHLRHKIDYHDGNSREEDLVDILPAKGFPVAFFARKERLEQYEPPAVMAHFNNIRNNVNVNIQCVAWAENFNDGKPQSSTLYTAKFTFFIK